MLVAQQIAAEHDLELPQLGVRKTHMSQNLNSQARFIGPALLPLTFGRAADSLKPKATTSDNKPAALPKW